MSDLHSPTVGSLGTPGQIPAQVSPELHAPAVQHEVRLIDRQRFAQPVCSCGWAGAARRARSTARSEARDHALLYADANAFIDD